VTAIFAELLAANRKHFLTSFGRRLPVLPPLVDAGYQRDASSQNVGSVNLSRRLDQLLQTDEPLSRSLNTAREPNEVKPGLHDVLRASMAADDASRFASPDTAFAATSELVTSRPESAFVNLLSWMRFLDCCKGVHGFYASVRLTIFATRL
jgi:hypothetical protein